MLKKIRLDDFINKKIRRFLLFFILINSFTPLRAQDCPVASNYSLSIGALKEIDTYLSPLTYTGSCVSLNGEWEKAFTPNPNVWSMGFKGDILFSNPLSPAKNSAMTTALVDFSYGVAIRKNVNYDFTLKAGLNAGFEAGVTYLSRNSNNPANAKAWTGIGVNFGIYKPIKIKHLVVRFSDIINFPTLGASFSPAYGETYYEIYIGNRSGLIHPAWWGNYFKISNHLAVELMLGKTALKLGYRYSFRNVDQCHNIWRTNLHQFTIGITPGGYKTPCINNVVIWPY